MRGNIKLYAILISTLLWSLNIQAYTHNKMDSGSLVKWKSERPEIIVHTNSSQIIQNSDVVQEVSAAINQWNEASPSLKIEATYQAGVGISSETNDLYFSSDHPFLGSGVAGVTVTATREATGELIEADIIINDVPDLSLDKEDDEYVGDIVAHELGHYLGLPHTEVQFATMFYRLTRGQHKLDDDDRAGARSLYSPSSYAGLSGRVIGGESRIGVFGAHVQAFSLETGEVAGSALSDENGNFNIKGLNGEDQFYLFIDRVKSPENLPSRYSEVKTDFCYSGRSYRGSFYQSCYSRDEGRPQAVQLAHGQTRSVGDITIRCGLETPVDYMQAKPSGTLDLSLKESRGDRIHIGESLVGFFNNGDVTDRVPDFFEFEIDTTDLPIQSGDEQYFVEVKTISQALRSSIRLSMELENNSSNLMTSQVSDALQTREDGVPSLENTLRMPISLNDPSANRFFLTLTPEALAAYTSRVGEFPGRFIPDYLTFYDPLNFYFLSVHIVQKKNGVFSSLSAENGVDMSSNRACPGAPETYSVDQTRNLSSQIGSNSITGSSGPEELNALGCGMILLGDDKGPPGGGNGMGLMVLFGVCFLMVNIASRQVRNIDF